jgi:hypothetical protein
LVCDPAVDGRAVVSPDLGNRVVGVGDDGEQIGSGGRIRRHMGWPARPVPGAETAEI